MQAQMDGHTILIGEDEFEVRVYLETVLKCLGYAVELANDGQEVITRLEACGSSISAVLLDLLMPERGGLDVLREIRAMYPDLPVIIISGAGSPLNIVAAMKNGATDFLCKPVTHEELQKAVHGALASGASIVAGSVAPAKLFRSNVFVGKSPHMQEIHSLVETIGWSEAPVLIQGETGSGKEVLARDLHKHSPRSQKTFLKLNCAALPSELVESELFGYERGAFTGAFQRKAGLFEAADGGTIFLDEIGDMDVRLQAKLLQVLQDREFQRIGGKETIKVDVRIMAATHRDLEKAIGERSFREDLYYRLNVINLQLPPLRARTEDIVPMAEYLLKKHAPPGRPVSLNGELKHAMMGYHWPGNVRELENVVRKLIVLPDPNLIARELRAKTRPMQVVNAAGSPEPPRVAAPEPGPSPILEQVTKAKEQAETRAILAALNSTRWNRKQAAILLKIDYKALLYKMKRLGIDDDVPFEEVSLGRVPKALSANAQNVS